MTTVSRLACLAVLLGLAGCPLLPEGGHVRQDPPPQPVSAPPAAPPSPSPEKVAEAMNKLNAAFRGAYEDLIRREGTRRVAPGAPAAFDAIDAALRRLGMIAESRDPASGTLTVAAPAPKPLNAEEWLAAVRSDGAMMMGILCPILGAACRQLKFEPDDYVIVINVTVAPDDGGSHVALTTRMREIRESQSGLPRREYPPPTAVALALRKIWFEFDRELAAHPARPR